MEVIKTDIKTKQMVSVKLDTEEFNSECSGENTIRRIFADDYFSTVAIHSCVNRASFQYSKQETMKFRNHRLI